VTTKFRISSSLTDKPRASVSQLSVHFTAEGPLAGTGALIPYLRGQGAADILAVDVSPNMLQELTRTYGEAPVLGNEATVRTWEGAFDDLPPHQGRADAIFMNAVFGNLPDSHGALLKCCSLLNPAGAAIISHPLGVPFMMLKGYTTLLRSAV
jgi:SAM-dependent methyltransferase